LRLILNTEIDGLDASRQVGESSTTASEKERPECRRRGVTVEEGLKVVYRVFRRVRSSS